MSSLDTLKKSLSDVAQTKVVSASGETRIEMKTYILDDLGALKKKWSMISHKPEIDVNGEAVNGSSINVDLKTSLFEIMKVKLTSNLNGHEEITDVSLPVTSKATARNGEEADVEYHLDITFTINEVVEKVKIKCFTTSCRMQIQGFGKHERKIHLGNEYIPKYFVNRFLVPFLEDERKNCLEFEKMFVPHLKEEIQRLQKKRIQDKTRKGSLAEIESKTARCENSNCQHKSNVTLKNVAAYGCCTKCKGYEHFHCAGTSKLMKEDIKLGQANFICTNCIEANPALAKEVCQTGPSTILVKALVSNPAEGTPSLGKYLFSIMQENPQ